MHNAVFDGDDARPGKLQGDAPGCRRGRCKAYLGPAVTAREIAGRRKRSAFKFGTDRETRSFRLLLEGDIDVRQAVFALNDAFGPDTALDRQPGKIGDGNVDHGLGNGQCVTPDAFAAGRQRERRDAVGGPDRRGAGKIAGCLLPGHGGKEAEIGQVEVDRPVRLEVGCKLHRTDEAVVADLCLEGGDRGAAVPGDDVGADVDRLTVEGAGCRQFRFGAPWRHGGIGIDDEIVQCATGERRSA